MALDSSWYYEYRHTKIFTRNSRQMSLIGLRKTGDFYMGRATILYGTTEEDGTEILDGDILVCLIYECV